MKKYDRVIFDLDGTLWDAAETSAQGWTAALETCGLDNIKISANDIRKVSGMPFDHCVQTLFPFLRPSLASEIFRVLDASEKEHIYRRGGRVFEGVIDGIKLLSKRYSLFLVSNCQDWYLDSFWRQYRLRAFFAGWDCHGLSNESKITMIERIVRRNGSSQSMYVGDTDSDRLAADAAGVDFGYASYGFGRAEGATATFSSLTSPQEA